MSAGRSSQNDCTRHPLGQGAVGPVLGGAGRHSCWLCGSCYSELEVKVLGQQPPPSSPPFPSSPCILPDKGCNPTVSMQVVWAKYSHFHWWRHSHRMRVNRREEAQGKRRQSQSCGGQSVGSQGDTKVSVP